MTNLHHFKFTPQVNAIIAATATDTIYIDGPYPMGFGDKTVSFYKVVVPIDRPYAEGCSIPGLQLFVDGCPDTILYPAAVKYRPWDSVGEVVKSSPKYEPVLCTHDRYTNSPEGLALARKLLLSYIVNGVGVKPFSDDIELIFKGYSEASHRMEYLHESALYRTFSHNPTELSRMFSVVSEYGKATGCRYKVAFRFAKQVVIARCVSENPSLEVCEIRNMQRDADVRKNYYLGEYENLSDKWEHDSILVVFQF